MQAEQHQNTSAPADGGTKREQSSVEFPYADLDTAVAVARNVADIGGDSCDLEHLAGVWQMAQSGGGFRAKYAPARIFGLLTVERSRAILTPLGRRIVDRAQEAGARAEAFLSIGLYRAIYDKYKGYQLPGKDALEGEMVRLGVAEKQKDKARQAFMRSARQGGFFWAGADRLVRPNVSAAAAPSAPETLEQEAADAPPPIVEQAGRRGGGGSGGGSPYDPLIQGLLNRLPEPGTVWAIEGRAAWLRAAATNFTLMYQGDGAIEVTATAAKSNGAAA